MGGRGGGSGISSPVSSEPKELTEEEIQSIKEYTGGAYSTINHGLRDGTKLTKDDKENIKNLDRVLENNKTTEDITVYRGFSDVSQIQNAEVGGTITDKGYVSTSTSEKAAKGFSRGTDDKGKMYIAEITIPKGSSVADVNKLIGTSSAKSKESEMLIGKNAKFDVNKISSVGRGPAQYNKIKMTYKG